MSIHKIGSDLIRPSGAGGAKRGSGSPEGEGAELARVARADRVDISAEGLELAAQLERESEGLSEGRRKAITARLANGFYNDPPTAKQVAERLQLSGDLVVEGS